VWTLLLLLSIGVLLAAGNVWVALVRSTIPIPIEGRITLKELRQEKHPGRDDVCYLHLDSGEALHVDAPLFEAVEEGQALQKAAWSPVLLHDGSEFPLRPSRDFWGMAITMPLVLLAVLVAGLLASFHCCRVI